ncbi:MAG: hypothetical protein HON68_11155 [Gammaproteobacteria bacterium]|jgi:hypothetical protein|nr:hypothetical protein [Gammaproteobacteria bacterium]MBT3488512.1 hypothetical protein [Gammaproteobacteria bacterium]MBT3717327.1 hypothetical protein [Gammaproteobacteria bacterium]MBT3845139.1 hypothetical protein [Gammaproteobacteria bacterium]MBT3893405.1 hypothetical protein [Gammaproteobacteria bacterium]
MEQILEIREGCNTPEQLIKSLPFSRFLKSYKKEFIENLDHRDVRRKNEAIHKVDFIRGVCARDFLKLLENSEIEAGNPLERARNLVRFLDGAFHHFRSSSYSRLVRLQNDVVSTGVETPDSVKDKVTEKATSLSDLILETRRTLLRKVDMEHGVRRSHGLDASPNVTAGEISGHYFNLPADYVALSHVPLTIAADIRTGVDYSTPSNKRAEPFYELDHNPLDLNQFNSEDWVSVPLQVGAWLIVAYLHKSRGSVEMEPGLLNLFPFAHIEDIKQNRRPDGIFIFSDPNAKSDDIGYYWDEESELLVGLVPDRDELKYFGYCKKPILTLHNVLAIRKGELPLHCGCTRYIVRFDEEQGPYIAEMLIKADDMGRIEMEKGSDDTVRPIFFGTETGAFACLDGFSEHAKLLMIGREVGYNKDTGSNARQIVPVTEDTEVMSGNPLDVLLYMNNFELVEHGTSAINAAMSVDEAIEHFRLGERVAAGSTHTHRGAKESSYWANPFPLLRDETETVLHPDLYTQFLKNEALFISSAKTLVERKELYLGVAFSQLMAGVYSENSDADLQRCGYNDRDEVEQLAPARLAEDIIDLIKEIALEKRELAGEHCSEVSITVALVGDSRTGKSETAEKMEGILGLQLV